jgi:hypothetical protein
MGIRIIDINFILLNLKRKKYDNILILGYQKIYFDSIYFESLLNKYGYNNYNKNINIINNSDQIDCLRLFGILSDNVDVMDVSDYEGANLIYDLSENPSILPGKYLAKYDLVLDWGTSEHVFNIINCYLNINNMLTDYGEFLCLTPMNTMPDHGYYQLSPNFYYDFFPKLYHATSINILQMQDVYSTSEKWNLFLYSRNCIDHIVNGGIDNKIYYNFIHSIKNKNKVNNDKIYQYQFQDHWKGINKSNKNELTSKKFQYFILGFEFITNLDHLLAQNYDSILKLERISQLNYSDCIN